MKRRRFLFINIGRFRLVIRKTFAAALFLLSLVLLILSKSESPAVKKITEGVVVAFSPVMQVMRYPLDLADRGSQAVVDFFNVYSQNKQLKADLQSIAVLKTKLKNLEHENKILQSQLNYIRPPDATFVTAKIVAQEKDGFSHSLLVYVGENALKIMAGQAVLSGDLVVGRIESVQGNYARVILLTDINSKIPVMTSKSKIHGILSGDNTSFPKLKFTDLNAGVKVGNTLVTSGVSGVFPRGLVVGRVIKTDADEIEVIPAVQINKVEYVEIIDYGLASIVVGQQRANEAQK